MADIAIRGVSKTYGKDQKVDRRAVAGQSRQASSW